MDQSGLFAPLDLGKRVVKNRIVSTAHGEMLCDQGVMSEHLIRYHARRAEGGAGMIIAFGSGSVHPQAATSGLVGLWNERNEPHLAKLADQVHRAGGLILAQATHRATRESLLGIDDVLQAPSAPPAAFKYGYHGAPHVLSTGEIEQIIEDYVAAARRLAKCGFDGIELTSLGSHLIEQFWSPTLNTRSDRFGGDPDGRMRFGTELVSRVHDAVPDDFLIAFRLSIDVATDRLGLGFDDICAIARKLDSYRKIDFFDISGGSGFDVRAHAASVPPSTFAEKTYADAAGALKQHLSRPVLVAGRILHQQAAEEILSSGKADLVAMTRALIADPDLPKRLQEREAPRVRPCIAINEGCRRVILGRSLACAVNPGVADPALMESRPAERQRKVAIIGAGPAGMEAARICAERGHAVELYERAGRLGGQMHDFSRLARWPHLLGHIDWLERELKRLDVRVNLNTDVTEAMLKAMAVDEIVFATGAESALPPEARPIEGISLRDTDLFSAATTASIAGSVVVYDVEGRLRGPKAAILAKELGARKVTLIVPHDIVCENLEPTNRPAIYRDLYDNGIEVVAHSHLLDQQAPGLRVRDSWTDITAFFDADRVIFAGYRRSNDALQSEIANSRLAARVHEAGDCRAPRLLRNAVSEGTRVALSI